MNRKFFVFAVLAFAMILNACNLPSNTSAETPTATAMQTAESSQVMQIGGSGLPIIIISPDEATATSANKWLIIGTMENGDQLIVSSGIFTYSESILSFDPSDDTYATIRSATDIELYNFKFQFNGDNSLTVSANGWVQTDPSKQDYKFIPFQ